MNDKRSDNTVTTSPRPVASSTVNPFRRLMLISLLVLLVGCGDLGDETVIGPAAGRSEAPGEDAPAMEQAGTEVEISTKSLTFRPKSITVKAGTTVVWMNEESTSTQHAIGQGAPDQPRSDFGSDFLQPGETYRFTFTQPGEYDYYCKNHKNLPSMVGAKIIVEE